MSRKFFSGLAMTIALLVAGAGVSQGQETPEPPEPPEPPESARGPFAPARFSPPSVNIGLRAEPVRADNPPGGPFPTAARH